MISHQISPCFLFLLGKGIGLSNNGWMSANQVLILNLLLLFLFLAIFLRRKQKTPSRLKLRNENIRGVKKEMVSSQPQKCDSSLRHAECAPSGMDIDENSDSRGHLTRNLNIHFEHQGKMWDAYQTLSLPAGVSFKEVEKTYLKILQTSEVDRELIMKAFDAIKKSIL